MKTSIDSLFAEEEFRVCAEQATSRADTQSILARISEFNKETSGGMDWLPVNIMLRNGEGKARGALLGWTMWSCFYIDTLWVDVDLQGRGYGRQLVEAGEKVGRVRGCAIAAVDTFSFQALGFYEKLGYSVFGRLPGFVRGMERFYLNKSL
jgi:ribosomal protein S18 acetylase RimI-like enzyme